MVLTQLAEREDGLAQIVALHEVVLVEQLDDDLAFAVVLGHLERHLLVRPHRVQVVGDHRRRVLETLKLHDAVPVCVC